MMPCYPEACVLKTAKNYNVVDLLLNCCKYRTSTQGRKQLCKQRQSNLALFDSVIIVVMINGDYEV